LTKRGLETASLDELEVEFEVTLDNKGFGDCIFKLVRGRV
jgi:hypothetical protein